MGLIQITVAGSLLQTMITLNRAVTGAVIDYICRQFGQSVNFNYVNALMRINMKIKNNGFILRLISSFV